MIRITCTSCKTLLTIDDAFAGGVCRCQHCGTIQTVPAHLKGSADRAAAQVGAAGTKGKKPAKALYAKKGAVDGSGLDALADVVASSGLRSSRLRKDAAAPVAGAKPLWQQPTVMLGAAGGAIVVLLVLVLYLAFGGSSKPKPGADSGGGTAAANDGSSTPAPVAPTPTGVGSGQTVHVTGPNFCGTPIDGTVVAYVIDNGNASAAFFDFLKSAVYRSAESLGPEKQFQIFFWSKGSDSYPSGSTPAYAVKANIDAARKKIEDVQAFGSTEPLDALNQAMGGRPDTIVLVTAKGADLSDGLLEQVKGIRGGSGVKIDTIAINPSNEPGVLGRIASETGGKYVPLSDAQVKAYAY